MKKVVKQALFFLVFCLVCAIAVYFYISASHPAKITILEGSQWDAPIRVTLCYSEGSSAIADSETWTFAGTLKRNPEQHWYGVLHTYSDEIVSRQFAVPLGFRDGVEMAENMGQIFEYKHFQDVEVLVLHDWYSDGKSFTVLYNKSDQLNQISFPVIETGYLGIHTEGAFLYVVVDQPSHLIVAQINTDDHTYQLHQIAYDSLVRDHTDLLQSLTLVKNGVLYLGEPSYDLATDTYDSTISSYDLATGKIQIVEYPGECLNRLCSYGDHLMALFATGLNERGYYQGLTLVELAQDLTHLEQTTIAELPADVDFWYMRDRSVIYNDKLYMVLNGVYISQDYLMVYDLKENSLAFLMELESTYAKKTLFDWNFCLEENGALYDLDGA